MMPNLSLIILLCSIRAKNYILNGGGNTIPNQCFSLDPGPKRTAQVLFSLLCSGHLTQHSKSLITSSVQSLLLRQQKHKRVLRRAKNHETTNGRL